MSGSPAGVVSRLTVRFLWRGTLVVAVAVAGLSAVVAGQHATMVAGTLDGGALRALAESPAIRVLFGPPVALEDPGGFTVWRTGTAVLVLVAAWALLAATRLTRGEEDAGRAELLLGGRLTRTDLVLRCLVAVVAATVVVGAVLAPALVVAGTDRAGALVHAAGVVGTGLTFAATGLLAAQVMPSRAAANGLAVAVLGTALLARMLADGVDELAWLGWGTPFGLAAHSAPFAGDRVGPLVVLAVLPLPLAAAALVAARRRDLGHGWLRSRSSRPPRPYLLGSVAGFAVRRTIGPTAGWTVGIGAYLLLIGTLLAEIVRFLGDNPRFADLASAAGFTGLGTTTGFAATMFGVVSVPVGLFLASRVAAMTADETARRATGLLALPLSRGRHLVTETAVLAAAALVSLAVAGLAFRVGAGLASAPLPLGEAVAGTLNTAPLAWLSLGAAVLAHGWAPRLVLAVGALPTAVGFLLHVVARGAAAPDWVVAVSPYAHLAAVPHTAPDWTATLTMTAVAAVLAALGVAGYARRDLLA